MELTANDIRNYEFPSQMRGYDKEEVDNFLEEAAAALESVKQENLRLSKEVESTNIQLTSLKQFEETIKSAAIDARRNADMTMSNARTEADQIVAKAKADAESILGSRSDDVAKIESQIAKLEHTRKSYLTKVRDLIQSHLDIIDEIMEKDPVATRQEKQNLAKTAEAPKAPGGINVIESSEVDMRQRETVSTQPASSQSIRMEEAQAGDPAIAEIVAKPNISDAEVVEAVKQLHSSRPKNEPETKQQASTSPASDESPAPTESGTAKPVAKTDANVTDAPRPSGSTPEDIGEALDDVVKTFEQKMDEASNS